MAKTYDLVIIGSGTAAQVASARLRAAGWEIAELEIRGDTAGALRLARENWKVQRELADARLVLQAAGAARDPGAAIDVLRFIETTGLADVRLKALQDKIAELRS